MQPTTAVLEDPTGRRRKRLRLAARLVAIVLTLWLAGLILGGVGLSPVPGIPFSHLLRPAAAPPAEKRPPVPAQPSAADLRPAVPAAHAPSARNTAVAVRPPSRTTGTSPRRAATKHVVAGSGAPTPVKRGVGHVHTTPAATAPASTTKPTKTSHPNNGHHTGTSTTTTTTTTPTTTTPTKSRGRSGSPPGQSGTVPPGQLKTQSATP